MDAGRLMICVLCIMHRCGQIDELCIVHHAWMRFTMKMCNEDVDHDALYLRVMHDNEPYLLVMHIGQFAMLTDNDNDYAPCLWMMKDDNAACLWKIWHQLFLIFVLMFLSFSLMMALMMPFSLL